MPAEKIAVVYDGVPLLEPAHGADIVSPSQKSGVAGRAGRAISRRQAEALDDLEHDLPRAALFLYLTQAKAWARACCWRCRPACR